MIIENHGQAGINVRILYGGAVVNSTRNDFRRPCSRAIAGRASTNAFKFKHLLESPA
jgi:hypothetical protein